MSKDILEIGDIWESDYHESIIDKVWGGNEHPICCHTIVRNKRNNVFSEENTGLFELKKYNNYKGKAKHLPETWYEVEYE